MTVEELAAALGSRIPLHAGRAWNTAQWADLYALAAVRVCPDSEAMQRRIAALTAGLVEVESGGGHYLVPKGPTGTGDWMGRTGPWLTAPGVEVVHYLPPEYVAANGGPPWAIPAGRHGWGIDLAQHDWGEPLNTAYFAALEPDGTPSWHVPAHALGARVPNYAGPDRGAAAILVSNLAQINEAIPNAPTWLREMTAVCGYNAKLERCLAIAAAGGDPNTITTGHNYGVDVVGHANAWMPS